MPGRKKSSVAKNESTVETEIAAPSDEQSTPLEEHIEVVDVPEDKELEESMDDENESEIEVEDEIIELDPNKKLELTEEQKALNDEVEGVLDSLEEEPETELEKGQLLEEVPEEESEEFEEVSSAEGEKSTESGDKGDKKDKRKRKQPKIDVNRNPKLKKIVQDCERIEDPNELKSLRDARNDETRELINKIKKIQIEIGNIRTQALDYRNKRDTLNKTVQTIKKDKLDVSEKLNESRSSLKDAKNDAKKTDDLKKRKATTGQIAFLRKKIDQLEKQIETEDMDLKKENEIVDEIDTLERQLQDLLKDSKKPKQFKEEIDHIREYKDQLKGTNDKLKDAAEESQNYHLLYLDVSKEMDDLRNEKRNLQRELNENRFIADLFHQRLIEMSQRQNREMRINRKSQYQNKKRIKKEIAKITLEDAKVKLKKGEKLNIFEARAFLEAKANEKETPEE